MEISLAPLTDWACVKCRKWTVRHYRVILSFQSWFRANEKNNQGSDDIMRFSECEQMAEALVWYIYTNGEVSYSLRPKQIYGPLADLFGVDEEERRRPRPDGYSGSH